MQPKIGTLSVLIATAALAACASAPTGPSVAVMPGSGKSFEQFNEDDAVCRQYAGNQTVGAADSANNKAVESGIVGTLIGAAAGAAIGGNHQGAAVGAGTGLLLGSAVGSSASEGGSYSAQRRYDIAYEQCMYAKGNSIPTMGQRQYSSRTAYSPPPPNYPPPPPPNYPPPPPPAQ
ncbi:MAG TPA: YMGG-like glycine zipper-containing protein [Burkholderiaceae bacterium]